MGIFEERIEEWRLYKKVNPRPVARSAGGLCIEQLIAIDIVMTLGVDEVAIVSRRKGKIFHCKRGEVKRC